MGLFNAYAADVQRVGATLASVIGGILVGPDKPSDVEWTIAGTRNGVRVVIELNQMHGVYGFRVPMPAHGVGRFTFSDEHAFFASKHAPFVENRIRLETKWDAHALWARLPGSAQQVILVLLASSGSSLGTRRDELVCQLGPAGMLRADDASDTILQVLDLFLVLADVFGTAWAIDPAEEGVALATPPPPPPEPPPPPPVAPRDAATIAARAIPARDAMLARHAGSRIELFPAVDALRACNTVKDKVVWLARSAPSEWVDDIIAKCITVGSPETGYYFARDNSESFQRVKRALDRYERATGVLLLDAPYEVIGRLTGEPRMVVVAGAARIGLDVAILGALVGDRVFVEAETVTDGESPYAGETD